MRSQYRILAVTVLLPLLLLFACHKNGTPSLALEECDPASFIPCIQPTAFVSIPIADSNLFLTYSSQWGTDRSGPRVWDCGTLGLGGWSLNVVQRYDKASRLLISGDGSWHVMEAVSLPSGEIAVPSFDGSVAYIFDSAGRHLRTVDGHLGTDLIRITYDAAGTLASLDGSAGSAPMHISVQRDARGIVRALIGIDGGTTGLAVDDAGRLTGVTNPARETTYIAWNSAGLVESETDPAGGVQRFTYDSLGRLASATDADGVTQRYERTASGDRVEISVSTALGRRWTYRSESSKGAIRRTFVGPDGTENSQTTDSHGNRAVKLSDGTTWSIGAVANPVWGKASPILTPIQETRPDSISSRREIKYSLQPQQGFSYLLAGAVTTNINGQVWTQHFDPARHTADLVDPIGRRTALQYDERGRLLSYASPDLPPVSYSYNAQGRRVTETVGSGKLARITRYNYDANSGQITRTRPDGVIENTMVDRAGRTVSTFVGNGSAVLLGYDAAGRVNQVQPPGGLNFILGMSAAGRPTGFVPPMVQEDASIETSSYDKDGQLTSISGLGNRAIAYSYDSAGRVTSSTFDQGKRTLSYDARSGLLSQTSDPGGVNLSYGYTGRTPTSLTWSGPINGSTSGTLDANGRVSRETINGSNSMDFSYDPSGNLTGVGQLSLTRDSATGLVTHTALGAIETGQEYDGYNRLIHTTIAASGKLLLDIRYTRDAMGRIKTVTENSNDGKSSTTQYSYDRADRLAVVRADGRTETYDYDPAGNRVSVLRGGKKLQASYDDRDQLLSFGNTQYKWMPDESLAGLAQGQHASAFVYDAFGALRQASLPDGRRIDYLVDADGRRVGRKIGGKLVAGYLYRPDGSIDAETDGSGKIVSRFGYDDLGHLAVVERGGMTYRVITDQLGSPRLILEARTGAVAEQIAYDAWGKVTQDSAPGFIAISFAGGLLDPDTGFIRFGARDYDPAAGHWTAADPIRFSGADANLHRYATADPVNRADPSGLDSADVPLPIGPPDQGITPYLPMGPGTPIGWTYRPPGDGTPALTGNPQTGNPPQNGNPTPSGGSNDWSCKGLSCTGPGGGCALGNCGNHGGTFTCYALYCDPGPYARGCLACSWGDVHVSVAERSHFDFQAAGEFLAAASPDGKLVVQSRQEPVLGGTEITLNTAVAANVNGDRIGVYAKEPSFLMVNGTAMDGADVEKRLPHGGTLQRHGTTVNLTWPDRTQLNVTRIGKTLNYGLNPSPNSKLAFIGLLGSGGSEQFRGRDGSILSRSDPALQAKLYRQFGNSWRIRQSESLFHYWPGESTATFTNLSIPSREVRAIALATEIRSKAETACRAVGVHSQPVLDDCILDVGVTGMPAIAAASVGIGTNPISSNPSEPVAASGSSASTPEAADHYSIHIGDTVSPDHPSPGAGIISKAGEKQTYSFSAQAGANVYVTVGPCSGTAPSFELRQPDEKIIGGHIGCGDFGPVAMPATGTYRVIAHANGPSARYTFTLRPTTLDQYSIKIGDTVSPDHPVPGAGIIRNLGQKQSYSFSAQAGDIVYLGIGPCEGTAPLLDIFTPDNNILDAQIGCHDLGREVLPQSGTYRVVARTDRDPARYSFSLRRVPHDQHFAIRLPLTVSPDSPELGRGRITAPGADQFYDFRAAPGSEISVKGKCSQPCPNLDIRVTTGRDTSRLGFLALDHLNFEWKVPAGGQYTMQVRSLGYIGNYAFTASEVHSHH